MCTKKYHILGSIQKNQIQCDRISEMLLSRALPKMESSKLGNAALENGN